MYIKQLQNNNKECICISHYSQINVNNTTGTQTKYRAIQYTTKIVVKNVLID